MNVSMSSRPEPTGFDQEMPCAFIDTRQLPCTIAGRPLAWWIDTFGLPLHINDGHTIRRNIEAFQRVFDEYYPSGRIRYAAKAYCHPALLEIVKQAGAGVEASSYNELQAALETGISPEDINLNGNAKEDFLLAKAVDDGILITADSIYELELVSRLAVSKNKTAKVLIRVSGFGKTGATDDCIFTSGVWSKFGVSSVDAEFVIDHLHRYPGLQLQGFHTHIGSQIAKKENYLHALSVLIALGRRLRRADQPCAVLNIGGGFPLSYVGEGEWNHIRKRVKEGAIAAESGDFSKLYVWNNESPERARTRQDSAYSDEWSGEVFHSPHPKEKMLRAILGGTVTVDGCSVTTIAALEALGRPQLLIEPGRSIVGDAGVTFARVNQVKEIAYGHQLLVLEMGVVNYAGSVIHKLLNRWAIMDDYHNADTKPFEAFVCGNLCYNGDIIAKYKIQLQRKPHRGDVVAIYDTGGTESHFFSSNANSYPRPARILLDDKRGIVVTKYRETFEDIFDQ